MCLSSSQFLLLRPTSPTAKLVAGGKNICSPLLIPCLRQAGCNQQASPIIMPSADKPAKYVKGNAGYFVDEEMKLVLSDFSLSDKIKFKQMTIIAD